MTKMIAAICRRKPEVGRLLMPSQEISAPGYERITVDLDVAKGSSFDFPPGADKWGFKGWLAVIDDEGIVKEFYPLRNSVSGTVTSFQGRKHKVEYIREGDIFYCTFVEGGEIPPGDSILFPTKVMEALGYGQ